MHVHLPVISGVNGVLLLTGNKVTYEMFYAAHEYYRAYNNSPQVQWILGPGFQDNAEYSRVKKALRGSLFLRPTEVDLSDFKEHFLKLNPVDYTLNPWSANNWRQKYIQCPSRREGLACPDADIQSRRRDFRLGNNVQETLVAVEMYTHALKDAHADLCGNTSGMCTSLLNMNRTQLDSYLKSVSFRSQNGVNVSPTEDGMLTRRTFDVMNIQLDGVTYRPVKVQCFVLFILKYEQQSHWLLQS